MREILFKAKRVDIGNWVEGLLCKQLIGSLFVPCIQVIKEYDSGDYLEHYEIIPETITQFTGLFDKKKNKIFENDLIKHGNFYWQSGSSEDWFGTEPQNSFTVVEAYPEIVESVVTFHNGMFILKTNWKNPKFKNVIRYPLYHLLNEKWNVVDEFEDQEPGHFKMMLEENDCKSSEDIKNILSEFEIIGNMFD